LAEPVDDLEALLAQADVAESSSEDGEPITEAELQGPHTEELAKRLADQESRELRRIQRLRRQKKRLKIALAAFKQKEKEFVAQMDAHMDEVEETERAYSKRIESLTAENQQLRERTERRARENAEQVEKLNETTKQCGESETRVQFLVDRIVALLSAGAADPSQTEAVVNLRQREREMLRMLEETRQQFDEVRQQNGELTTRLTEELSLSRRLSDQLAEVEERFFHQKPENLCLPRSPCDGDASLRTAPRLGARPLGLRSDQLEAPPERPERAAPPDLPPPISEAEAADEEDSSFEEHSEVPATVSSRAFGGVGGHGRRKLGAVLEAEALSQEECEFSFGDFMEDAKGTEAQLEHLEASPEAADEDDDLIEEGELDEEPCRGEAGVSVCSEDAAQSDTGLKVSHSSGLSTANSIAAATSTARAELMEGKLRDALDRAAFECAVVRVEPGVYNFGPSVQAVVQLTENDEVVASRDGGPFEPIDSFIQRVGEEGSGGSGSEEPEVMEEAAPRQLPTQPAQVPPMPQPQTQQQPQPQPQPQPQQPQPQMLNTQQPFVPPLPSMPAARLTGGAGLAGPSIFACSGGSCAGAAGFTTTAAATIATAGQPSISPRAVSPAPVTYVTQPSPRPAQWQTAQPRQTSPPPGTAVPTVAVQPGAVVGQNAAWSAMAAARAASPTGDVRSSRQAGVVPSLQLSGHTAPGPLLVGRQSSSSTPERPRVCGLQGMPAPTNTGAAGQLFSPRPQTMQMQKAVAGQVATNPRLMASANVGTLRMGMAQAPRHYGQATQGSPQRLHFSQ